METTLFVCSLIACIIGVLTFVSGLNTKAKSDGAVLQKIDQAISGIEELKKDVRQQGITQQELALAVNSNKEKIQTLFKEIENLDKTNQILMELLAVLKQ